MFDDTLPAPSQWIATWSSLIPSGSRVLDLACGAGRHTLLLAQRGHEVVAVDRDLGALIAWSSKSQWCTRIEPQCHDLESKPWPFAPATFDAIVVTNYLHRPLFVPLLEALRPGGILLYETFARGNERYGKPSNPDFLLAPGELLQRVQPTLRVIAYQDLYVQYPKPALMQRVCAIKAERVPEVAAG